MTQPINLTEERTPNVTQEPPFWLVREIGRVGGVVENTSGSRPRFRVIWGGNRWTVAQDGVTLVRPYRVDMWHLEKFHEGEYEHCYRLGECPSPGHRNLKSDKWCRACFMDGGIPMKIDGCWGFVEGVIRLLLKTEEMQQRAVANGRVNTEQRDALLGREAVKGVAKDNAIKEATADAAPVTVKRSFQTPLRISAQQALGNTKGLKQLNAREIARGIRRRKSA